MPLLAGGAAGLFGFSWLVAYLLFRWPPPWPDESLYADIIQNFIHDGTLGIPLFKGYFAQVESHQHFYPPFYFLMGKLVFSWVPLSLATLRLFSLFALGGAVYLAVRYVVRPWGSTRAAAMAVLILFLDPLFLRGALVGRMDALAVFCIMASLVLTHLAELEARDRQRRALFFAAGLAAGAAFLTHPMAWAASLTLAIYLLIRVAQRVVRVRDSALVVLGGLMLLLPYLFWLWGEWPYFLEQFAAQMARKEKVSPKTVADWFHAYRGLFDNYGRFRGLGFLVALLGWVGLVGYALKDKRGLKFLIAHVVLVLLATYSREMWYPIYFMITGALGLAYLVHRSPRKSRPVWVAAGMVTATMGIALSNKVHELRKISWADYCRQITTLVPAGSNVFLASVPDAYFCFDELTRRKMAQFIPGKIPVLQELAAKVFDRYDYFIGSQNFFGEHLADYLAHRESDFKIVSGSAGGYAFQIAIRKIPQRR